MHNARLQQCDAPRVLYERPVNTFVAGFIGSPAMNLVSAPVTNGSVDLGGVAISVPANGRSSVVVGVRPESLELAGDGIPALVEVVEEIGADAYVFCSAEVSGVETKRRRQERPRAGRARLPEADRGGRAPLRPGRRQPHLLATRSSFRMRPISSLRRSPAGLRSGT
jgi:multiple sugar transport system ATP-binding protein